MCILATVTTPSFAHSMLNEIPVLIKPVELFGNQPALKAEALEKMKDRPSNIKLTYYGDDINSYNDTSRFVNSIIDTGSYNTADINRFHTYYENYKGKSTLRFRVEYMTSSVQEDFVNNETDRIIHNIITKDMTDYEKVKVVHDYLVNTSTFSSNTNTSQYTAYTLLKEKKGVCNAYAMAFSKFMDKLNISNYYVKGDANGDTSNNDWALHAWNKVKIDGLWYNIDTSWSYPIHQHGLHNTYKHFLNSDDRFYKTHKPDNLSDLPKSKDTRYDGIYDGNYNKK